MDIVRLSTAYSTIVRKEVSRFIRIWPQTFMPSVITTVLYFLVFGKIIGNQIKHIDGLQYIDYITPGLVMMSVISGSYNNTASSFFSSKFQRSIEELLVSPTPRWVIMVGYVTGGIIRGMVSGILVLCVASFFMKIKFYSIAISFLVLFLTSAIFATVGLINGVFARNFDDISWIPSFILTPMSYLGGIFYSVEDLPGIWAKLSLFNPVFHSIDAFRHSMFGIGILGVEVTIAISFGLLFTLIFITLGLMKVKLQE